MTVDIHIAAKHPMAEGGSIVSAVSLDESFSQNFANYVPGDHLLVASLLHNDWRFWSTVPGRIRSIDTLFEILLY